MWTGDFFQGSQEKAPQAGEAWSDEATPSGDRVKEPGAEEGPGGLVQPGPRGGCVQEMAAAPWSLLT